MKKKLIVFITALVCVACCALAFAACAETVAAENVALDKTELTLEVGGEQTLTATVTPDNAADKTVVWSSSDPAIATVENGKVTAVAAGTAVITATASGKSATCAVTVHVAKAVRMTKAEWDAAIHATGNARNFTVACYEGEIGEETEADQNVFLRLDDVSGIVYAPEEGDGENIYFAFEDGKVWQYYIPFFGEYKGQAIKKDYSSWISEEGYDVDLKGMLDYLTADFFTYDVPITLICNAYDGNCAFDEDTNTYTLPFRTTDEDAEEDDGIRELKISFVDGKVSEVSFFGETELIVRFVFRDYGTTRVTLPDIYADVHAILD